MKSLLKNTDFILLITILLLVTIGIVGIFSAGYSSEDSTGEYIKQFIWFIVAFGAIASVWMLDYNYMSILGYMLYAITTVLLVIVLFTEPINGASSWFNLGFFSFQPSELMKIAYILTTAKVISSMLNKEKLAINKWYNILIILGITAVPLLLILKQPDFGTSVAFISILCFMLYKAKISYKYILIAFLIIIILAPVVYFFGINDIQKERILVFLNPERDPLGSGYNALQSKMAIGSGQMFGTGLLKGTQTQYGYLPVKSSDFIFAVISEELGFLISSLVVALYTVMLFRIINISKTAKDSFGSLVAIGVAGMIFFHFVENIGMTMGILPITGVPLPFVSYGGSSLLTNCIAMGLVLSISARRQRSFFVE